MVAPKDQPEPEWSPLSGLGQGALAAVWGAHARLVPLALGMTTLGPIESRDP